MENDAIQKQTLNEFMDALASSDPTPGGGGASALAGATAASLACMVARLNVRKKAFAELAPQYGILIQDCETMQEQFLKLMKADEEAFLPLSQAYKLPHATEEEKAAREEVIQPLYEKAASVPAQILRTSRWLAEQLEWLSENSSSLTGSDVGCAAAQCCAAADGSWLMLAVNAACIRNQELAHRLISEGTEQRDRVRKITAQIQADLEKKYLD